MRSAARKNLTLPRCEFCNLVVKNVNAYSAHFRQLKYADCREKKSSQKKMVLAAKIKRKSNKEANLINEIVPPTQHEKCEAEKTVAENEDTRVWDVAGDVDNKEFVYSAAYLDKLAEDVIKCRVPEPVLCLKQLVVIPKKKVKKSPKILLVG